VFVVKDDLNMRGRFGCKDGRRACDTFERHALKVEAGFFPQFALGSVMRFPLPSIAPAGGVHAHSPSKITAARVSSVQDQELARPITVSPHDDASSTPQSVVRGPARNVRGTPPADRRPPTAPPQPRGARQVAVTEIRAAPISPIPRRHKKRDVAARTLPFASRSVHHLSLRINPDHWMRANQTGGSRGDGSGLGVSGGRPQPGGCCASRKDGRCSRRHSRCR
jgi:hypothetical protein